MGVMVAVFLALTIQQNRPITFEADAIRAKDLVSEIARQSGQDLACEAMIANEPLVVAIEGKPLEACLDKVAEVLGAEWRVSGTQKRLGRSTQSTTRFRRDEDEFAAKLIDAAIQKAVAFADAQPPIDDAIADRLANQTGLQRDDPEGHRAELRFITDAHPATKAAARCLAAITTKNLLQIPVGARVVYSTQPNRMQRPLPKSANAAIAKMVDEAKHLNEARSKLDPNNQRTNYGGVPMLGKGDAFHYEKTVFSVRRMSSVRIAYRIICVDEEGAGILSATGTIPDTQLAFTEPFSHKGTKLEIDENLRRISMLLSDLGVAAGMSQTISLPNGGQTSGGYSVTFAEQEKLPEDFGFGELLQDPVKNDPVGFVFAPVAKRIAKSENVSLIATIPDNAVVNFARDLRYRTIATENDALDWLEQRQIAEAFRIPYAAVERKPGWLVIRPFFQASALKNRFNREAAKELIGVVKSQGSPNLDAAIRYIERSPVVPSFNSLDRLLISHAVKEVDRQAVEWLLLSPIEILGALGFEGRRALASGEASFRGLSQPIQSLLSDWVYGVDELQRLGDPFWHSKSPLDNEPTERFPNGIPAEALVGLAINEQPAVIASTESGAVRHLSVYDLAFHESMNPTQPIMGQHGPPRKYTAYRPARQTNYTLSFVLDDKLTLSKTIVEKSNIPGAQAGPRAQLPSDLLQAIDDAGKRIFRRP